MAARRAIGRLRAEGQKQVPIKTANHGRLRQATKSYGRPLVRQVVYGAATAMGTAIVSLITLVVQRHL